VRVRLGAVAHAVDAAADTVPSRLGLGLEALDLRVVDRLEIAAPEDRGREAIRDGDPLVRVDGRPRAYGREGAEHIAVRARPRVRGDAPDQPGPACVVLVTGRARAADVEGAEAIRLAVDH